MRERGRRRAAPDGDFAPEHPEIAGRSLVLPVSTRGRGAPQAWLVAGARRRQPRRLRAADPPAGRDGRGARADAPARDARHRAPARRRRARRGADRPAGARARSSRGCGRSASATRRPCWCSPATTRRGRARPRGRARRVGHRRAGRDAASELLCAVVDAAGELDPVELARRAARRAGRRPRRRARPRGGKPRRAGGDGPAQLPRGALRARGDGARQRRRARGRLATRTSAPSSCCSPLQDDDALRLYSRQRARAARGRRRRVRRRAAALARGVHRAERPVGEGRAPALLPPPHAALPDQADRGADRARPEVGARTGSSSGWRCAARELVPDEAIVRRAWVARRRSSHRRSCATWPESEEVRASCVLLDLDRRRSRRAAGLADAPRRSAWAGARAAEVDARGGLAAALDGCRRARQLGELPRQPRRDARLPRGRLPLHRPRRALLDDRRPARAVGRVRGAGLLALLGMGSSPGKTNVMAARAVRRAGRDAAASRRDRRRPRPRSARRARASPTRCRRSSTS